MPDKAGAITEFSSFNTWMGTIRANGVGWRHVWMTTLAGHLLI